MTLNDIPGLCRSLSLKGAAECLERLSGTDPDFMVSMPADVIPGTMLPKKGTAAAAADATLSLSCPVCPAAR